MPEDKLLPIGAISTITGVNSMTLRAWQRRYGLLKPQRTPSGHRLYSETDIDTIRQILFWMEKGIAVSKVKPYLSKNGSSSYEATQHPVDTSTVCRAVSQFNQNTLAQCFDEYFSLYPVDIFARKIYPQILTTLNQQWAISDTAFSEEQFFFSYLKNRLAANLLLNKTSKQAPKITIAALNEANSEIALLFLSASLSLHQYQIVYLGNHVDQTEMSDVLSQTQSQALILFSNLKGSSLKAIRHIAEKTPTQIFIASNQQQKPDKSLTQANVTLLSDEHNLMMKQINEVLKRS